MVVGMVVLRDPCKTSARKQPFSVAAQSPYWRTTIVQSEAGESGQRFDWLGQVNSTDNSFTLLVILHCRQLPQSGLSHWL